MDHAAPMPWRSCFIQRKMVQRCAMHGRSFDSVGFDLDGTLVDTLADLAASADHALHQMGLRPLGPAGIRPLIGNGTRAMLARAAAATAADAAAVDTRIGAQDAAWDEDRLLARFMDHYTVHIADRSVPFPGARDTLRALKDAGMFVAVVTNKDEALARRLLDALGLARWIDRVIGGDSLGGPRKPDPAPLHAMVAAGGGGPALYIGDSRIDLAAARAGRLPVVLCRHGYETVPLDTLGADAVIDGLDALPGLVARWPERRRA